MMSVGRNKISGDSLVCTQRHNFKYNPLPDRLTNKTRSSTSDLNSKTKMIQQA